MKNRFNKRGFLSIYMVLSFLVIVVSGIILYISPPGRIANWSYWRFLGLLKSQWQAVHTIFTFIFIAAVSFHLFFNWKPLLFYIKNKFKSLLPLRKELVAASVLSLLFFILTINNISPFVDVMDFGETLKGSWSTQTTEPPIPHAEEQSLVEFSKTVNIPIDDLKNKLNAQGFTINNDKAQIKEIAVLNKVAPSEIYNAIKDENSTHNIQSGSGKGFGRKTLEEYCSENNIQIELAISNLNKKGYSAKSSEKLKEIATRHNLLPIDIINAIHNDGN